MPAGRQYASQSAAHFTRIKQMNKKHIVKTALIVATAAVLSACMTKSKVNRDGTTDNPVWPKLSKISPSFDHNRGTFPTADELDKIKAGMTKDEFYKLLGRPHFNEGMFNVREWDYVFHFHTPGQGTNDVTTCQFKIVYDSKKIARSFHWKAVDPETATCPVVEPKPEPQVIVREVESTPKRIRQ